MRFQSRSPVAISTITREDETALTLIRFDSEKKHLRLSVGDLVHHGQDASLRQVPSAGLRLAAGTREHANWRADVEESADRTAFNAEVALEYRTERREFGVTIEGRLDGLHLEDGRWIVEEVKTVILPAGAFTDTVFTEDLAAAVESGRAYLHYRFQLEIYLLMVAQNPLRLGAEGPEVAPEPDKTAVGRLVFRNLAAGEEDAQEFAVDVRPDLESVREEVHRRLDDLLGGLLDRETRRSRVRASASGLPFPFESYRQGQQDVVDEVRSTLEAGEQLMFSAAPGIGKTAAVLHAVLTFALARGLKVFWVTAKTTQQRLVAETLRMIARRFEESETDSGSPPFRALVLRARDKICPNLAEGGRVFCHGDYCRYARDYTRKLREHAVFEGFRELAVIEPDTIYERGVAAEVCPFEASLELVSEADVIIGDYNYVFDPRSALRRSGLEQLASNAVLVIDEAHNLYNRGREYFSPELDLGVAEALLRAVEATSATTEEGRELFEANHRLRDGLIDMLQDLVDSAGEVPTGQTQAVQTSFDSGPIRELEALVESARMKRLVGSGLEGKRVDDSVDVALQDTLEELSRSLRDFVTALDLGESGVPMAALVDTTRASTRLRLICLDPSKPLGDRLRRFRSSIAMSATLQPFEFFRALSGFPSDTTRTVSYPPPFPSENRLVRVVPDVVTTFRGRKRDLGKVAKLIDEVAAARPGNYLAFFSSHRYLREVLTQVLPWRIGADVLVQSRSMDEEARDRTLEMLREPGSARILYAVQGGIFGEGVDYPGDMARGVIVVGPGLPRFDMASQLVRRHFDGLYQKGFEYAYVYPGMHRVIQSAGRLIRGPDETGVVVLVGERFARSQYQRLFPSDWYEQSPQELVTEDLLADLRAFWEARDG